MTELVQRKERLIDGKGSSMFLDRIETQIIGMHIHYIGYLP